MCTDSVGNFYFDKELAKILLEHTHTEKELYTLYILLNRIYNLIYCIDKYFMSISRYTGHTRKLEIKGW